MGNLSNYRTKHFRLRTIVPDVDKFGNIVDFYINLVSKPIIMYKRVARNISKEGNSYRVRYQKNGKRFSKFFSKRTEAIAYKKKVIG